MPLSGFHPAIAQWFRSRLGEPTPPQRRGWPAIQSGRNVLIAAPTGSGKTLAAFLSGLDELLRKGDALAKTTQLLYVSPLRALAHDVQKNLLAPLAEIRALDPSLPEVRVLVRTGDTPASERARMARKPPHVLVTTPESLYLLLTCDSGRRMLAGVQSAIVDEIHALARDRRGAHLALSLERLEALAGPFQRIGLSATQRPLDEVGRYLVGVGREVELIDEGHRRPLALTVEVPPSPLDAVCSHEQWDEIHARVVELAKAVRTTIVFVNTRKLAERLAARLGELLRETLGDPLGERLGASLGGGLVLCHHGSLSRERRLHAETKLKAGELRILVATSSLELGIDVGEVDLAIQIGSVRAIATLLQRVGRAGHGVGRVSRGIVFPLTRDELVEAAACARAIAAGELERTRVPRGTVDVLGQQIVAACVSEAWSEDDLHRRYRRAYPFRDLAREEFDGAVALYTAGRGALLHRDGVHGRLRATRRAPIPARTGGGTIPDAGEYRVLLEPEGALVGTVHEDFAVEASRGDVFQLGTASWRVLRVETGIVRVADAQGAPPTIPFWLGEAPSRSEELSTTLSALRVDATLTELPCLTPAAADQLRAYLDEARRDLPAMPTRARLVAERFFDESGGTQLVLHAPFGGRVNRALGLALRKRICRGFGVELQAAANEDAIVFSLGPSQGLSPDELFELLSPERAREVLLQAVLATPMFEQRWRWNATRSLLVARSRAGRTVPIRLQRMRAEDLLATAFPAAVACAETLPPGDVAIPMGHPLVKQTVDDCLDEALDAEGFVAVVRGLSDGTIERVAVDRPSPSVLARGILAAAPYSFLDDAPLEERRTLAVARRTALDDATADAIGALDPEAVESVRREAWPRAESAEEVHEALGWMGFVTDSEAGAWQAWLEELARAGRVIHDGASSNGGADDTGRWRAVEASTDEKEVWRGRLQALGPVESDDPVLAALEQEGFCLRARIGGRSVWCERGLLARIHRRTLDRLRREISPVSAADFQRFLVEWQHVGGARRLEGPRGVMQVIEQLAGVEAPAIAWERTILSARVAGYRRDWLDGLVLTGEVAWGRLWGSGASAPRATPIALVPRAELEGWLALAGRAPAEPASSNARAVLDALTARGACFVRELAEATRLLPSPLEAGIAECLARGLATADSFAALRWLFVPPSRRKAPLAAPGRFGLFRAREALALETSRVGAWASSPAEDLAARALLRRTGVVFRRTLMRERIPVPWYRLVRIYRTLEARGEVRGGRFVAGFDGEQYALPEAIELLRSTRRDAAAGKLEIELHASDPLSLRAWLDPTVRPLFDGTQRSNAAGFEVAAASSA